MSKPLNKTHCYIGLTQWHHADWQDTLLLRSKYESPLSAYAKHFSSVEGNTTFYGLPKDETVMQWREETPEQFKFCFKFPQTITHQHQLRSCSSETVAFFHKLAPLQGKIGQLCIQLPGHFSGAEIPALSQFLKTLSNEFTYGIEVRHLDYFDKQHHEQAFNRLLNEHQINRINFDTRALFAHPADDPVSLKAKDHKPQMPVHAIATGHQPLVRFITPLDWQWGTVYLEPWINKAELWLNEGKTPYFFFHTPDNIEAPALAKYFVEQLEQRIPNCCLLAPWNENKAAQTALF